MEPLYNTTKFYKTLNKGDLVQEQGKPVVRVLEDLNDDFTWESLYWLSQNYKNYL